MEYIGKFVREMRSSLCRNDELYQSPRCQGVFGVEAEYTYYQDMSSVISLASFLSEMQHVAFSPIAFISMPVCLCMHVRSFQHLIGGPHENGLRQFHHFFTIVKVIKMPSNDVFGHVAHDIDLFFEGHRYHTIQLN